LGGYFLIMLQGSLFDDDGLLEPLSIINEKGLGEAIYYPNFFSATESENYFNLCNSEKVSWNRETIRMYGNEHLVPRDTAWFSKEGLAYTYSGIKMNPDPYPEFIKMIQEKIETIEEFGFNSVLLNRYNNGSDKVSWHSDNERELSGIVNIASVSFGSERVFQFRRIPNTKKDLEINLEHGSLLIMKDPLQQKWEHQIPKTLKNVGPRINLTFRKIVV